MKVQQINEDDVFNLNLPKKTSFIDILFNSSYRKILDREPINYKLYNEYEIDFDLFENIMEDLLLNNKTLLNETITEFFIIMNHLIMKLQIYLPYLKKIILVLILYPMIKLKFINFVMIIMITKQFIKK